jgi:transposase
MKPDYRNVRSGSALHLSLGVVNKYLNAAQAAGITWPPPEDLSESQLRRKLLPPDSSSFEPVYAQPDFAAIHQELKRKGLTRQLLWEEYAEANPDNHYQYTQFCFHYQQWCGRLRLSMRQIHRAGEKMFVDYAGPTVPIINPTTGEIAEAQIFVAVLGASNYTFAEATFSQQLHDWIGSHVRAFEFFRGAPKLVVPDNPKSAVTRADRYEPVLNRSYQEMLEARKHPEMAYRSCLGLLSLANRYTPERVETACQHALALGALRQSSVRTILEKGLDSQPLPEPEPEPEAAATLPVHENVRGAAYYQ